MIDEDPVCHMQVTSTLITSEYEGIHYAFCSAQCRERFLANPRLYIGLPGRKAPAQQGREVIKKRSLMLSEPLDAVQAGQVKQALLSMMGIQAVHIEANKIEIQYDLIQVTTEQIADKLTFIDSELGVGWVDRLKLAFINYREECEIGSLEVENKKGCH
jgi:YHS domain-containing protein/copper chaperone CopZ